MSKQKHTPGPWRWWIDDIGNEIFLIDSQKDSILGPTFEINGKTGSVALRCDVTRANARLIAAAPELLDALKALLGLTLSDNGNQSAAAVEDMARAAIAKAEGATP